MSGNQQPNRKPIEPIDYRAGEYSSTNDDFYASPNEGLNSPSANSSRSLNDPLFGTTLHHKSPSGDRKKAQTRSHSSANVEPFPVQKPQNQTPVLPKLKSPQVKQSQPITNPDLAMNLLQELQQLVTSWQQELNRIQQQIESLHQEGPIINGWLESHSNDPDKNITSLRHAEIDELMNYVEKTLTQTDGSALADYRLCGLDENGELWSKRCPARQVPAVSLAIARYQKLRQLVNQKELLETRLAQLAESLVVCRGQLQI
ncbi:MAG: hypothetical protein KME17_11010 [Cyanosarcina radialis HA8281-LM2]|jgi:hypothetical protein|nr:hypothetical protein [Cyanosarcina radialis HA8281-LM2]